MVKLEDTLDLGSNAERRAGSSPVISTTPSRSGIWAIISKHFSVNIDFVSLNYHRPGNAEQYRCLRYVVYGKRLIRRRSKTYREVVARLTLIKARAHASVDSW